MGANNGYSSMQYTPGMFNDLGINQDLMSQGNTNFTGGNGFDSMQGLSMDNFRIENDPANPMGGGGMFDSFGNFGNWLTNTEGQAGNQVSSPLMQGLSAGKGLFDSWQGMKQLKLSEDMFDFQKDAWNKNYNQQRQSINTQLGDRQRARLSADSSGSYASLKDYMNKNGV